MVLTMKLRFQSEFFTILQIFVYIQSNLKVFGLLQYSDLTCLINNERLFGFSQIFNKFSLGFEYH
jgi:hypothetical protein